MNIKQAKEEIKNTIQAYRQKDEFGDYLIDRVRQRPILLLGAPGIGKTAIMEQVAHELGIGLVAYSITHHTRQSAIGLPFISERQYDGETHKITEYTMSEIVSSVYDAIEYNGYREGILFIDEINCASETLAPTMLQFLQYKTFGQHRVPDGWTLVAAGNPPEYNKSVRDFDIVTLDRLKKIEVEPDYRAWKEYAYRNNVHGAIISYLDIQNTHFYTIESTVDGKEIITARGWEDLSQIVHIYEKLGIPVTRDVVVQYLQHSKIARQFANYFDLYKKYQDDYQIDEILAGDYDLATLEKVRKARFDEKISLVSLLTNKLFSLMTDVMKQEAAIAFVFSRLKQIKPLMIGSPQDYGTVIDRLVEKENQAYQDKVKKKLLDKAQREIEQRALDLLGQYAQSVHKPGLKDGQAAFSLIRDQFNREVKNKESQAAKVNNGIDNAFLFVEKAFGASQEIVILVTELTMHYYSAKFLSMNSNAQFLKYNKELLFNDKERSILQEIDEYENMTGEPL